MKYFWDTIKHKWFVILASFWTGLPLWIVLVHDMSKFSKEELPHYNRRFFGANDDPDGFEKAWKHHCEKNDHHWQWWIRNTGYNDGVVDVNWQIPMSNIAVLHMLTDWIAVRRTQYGTFDSKKWKRPVGPQGAGLHRESLATLLFEVKRLGLYDEEAWE